jgi:hypothetical protein
LSIFGHFFVDFSDIFVDFSRFFVIFFLGSRKSGFGWKKFGPGFWDGWLYGRIGPDGKFSGDDVAYVYADLSSAIFGTFEKSVLVEGRARKIRKFR